MRPRHAAGTLAMVALPLLALVGPGAISAKGVPPVGEQIRLSTAPQMPSSGRFRDLAVGSAPSGRLTEGLPNIVVVMLDDHPALTSDFYGRLPNMNSQFLDRGIEFSNYWANYSLCCPGRASFLTGQFAHHHGVTRNIGRLFDPSETIATELQSVGYHTMICGKYFNRLSDIPDKTPVGWDDAAIKGDGPYFDYPVWVNGVKETHRHQDSDYSTDVIAGHCQNFMADITGDQPLFMLLTPNATHGGWDENGEKDGKLPVAAPRHRGDNRCEGVQPWKPASYNEVDVSDKPAYVRSKPLLPIAGGWPLLKACEAMLSVDEWFGSVIDTLKEQQRFDNTVFILTADNGMGWGAHRWAGKVAPHTAQMPLFIAWPAVITTPSTDDTLLANVDLAPTLCELAGCAMGPFPNGFGVDGQSFTGLIAGSLNSSTPDRDATVIEGGGNGAVPGFRAIITASSHDLGQWLFVRYPETREKELYDLSGGPCTSWESGDEGDPCMMDNVAGAARYRDVKTALRTELESIW